MKKLGLIGGIGPESTIEYYSQIIKRFRALTGSNSYPELLIESIDMSRILEYVSNEDHDSLINFLKDRITIIESAQVDFGAIASNTPHIVFDKLSEKVNIPLISIVEETCKNAEEKGLKTIGLLGTMSTMSQGFYQKTANKHGIKIITPKENQMTYIHDKYVNELIYRNIKQDTKTELINIVNHLYQQFSIEGVILGGTELSLILSQDDFDKIEVLDTTKIHVDSIVKMILSD